MQRNSNNGLWFVLVYISLFFEYSYQTPNLLDIQKTSFFPEFPVLTFFNETNTPDVRNYSIEVLLKNNQEKLKKGVVTDSPKNPLPDDGDAKVFTMLMNRIL